jgi:hypothetical protein
VTEQPRETGLAILVSSKPILANSGCANRMTPNVLS